MKLSRPTLRLAIPIGLLLLVTSRSPGAGPETSSPSAIVGNWPAVRAVNAPLPLTAVRLGGFLGKHVEASHDSLLPGLDSPLPGAFEARARGEEPPPECRRLATDSDFYKWLEGACYALASEPDRVDLRAAVDRYVTMITRTQEPDGYLGTRVLPARPFDENVRHDLYIAGHLIEAAVAHHAATGRRELLDAAVRLADYYRAAYAQHHPYYKQLRREHPELELALVRLARATGENRFVDFSAALTREAKLTPPFADVVAGASRHHAVRVCYQLMGAAELFLQNGDEAFKLPLGPLWREIVDTRMYLTGGIGYNEVIPDQPYDLPQTLEQNPNRDIAETCASVSMMMFSWRMHAINGQSAPYDVIERILYNHCLGALSPDHRGNFYYNPLRRVGPLTGKTDHGGDPVRRTMLPKIHSTACCLPNAWRFFGQLPEYVFSTRGDDLFVNLYTTCDARHRLRGGHTVQIHVETRYPDEGRIALSITPERDAEFTLNLRIPDWCRRGTWRVNSEPVKAGVAGRYAAILRTWHAGDRVELDLEMNPVMRRADPAVEANRGQVAFQRGPLIYCLEREDAAGMDLGAVAVQMGDPPPATPQDWDDTLHCYRLNVQAGVLKSPSSVPTDTRPAGSMQDVREIRLIPFYLRANRAEDTRWLTWIPAVAEKSTR